MDICFEGIGQVVATFRTEDETLEAGMAVTLTDNGEVELGDDGDPLCGVTVGAIRNGAVAVQIGGVVKVGGSDDDGELRTGWQELVCNGNGGVRTAQDDQDEETGVMKFLVLAVDEVESEDKGENGDGDKNKKSIVVKL